MAGKNVQEIQEGDVSSDDSQIQKVVSKVNRVITIKKVLSAKQQAHLDKVAKERKGKRYTLKVDSESVDIPEKIVEKKPKEKAKVPVTVPEPEPISSEEETEPEPKPKKKIRQKIVIESSSESEEEVIVFKRKKTKQKSPPKVVKKKPVKKVVKKPVKKPEVIPEAPPAIKFSRNLF
jgi:hypothetical protein